MNTSRQIDSRLRRGLCALLATCSLVTIVSAQEPVLVNDQSGGQIALESETALSVSGIAGTVAEGCIWQLRQIWWRRSAGSLEGLTMVSRIDWIGAPGV